MDGIDHDHLFKIIVIGDGGVGKSTLLNKFCIDSKTQQLPTTIGVDFMVSDIYIDGKLVKLQLWDTAGQEQYKALTSQFYRGSHAVILMFDLSYQASLDHIPDWIRLVQENCASDPFKILVGNKCDILPPAVSRDSIEKICNFHELRYFETSARDIKDVLCVFKELTRDLLVLRGQLSDQSLETTDSNTAVLSFVNRMRQDNSQPETTCCSYY